MDLLILTGKCGIGRQINLNVKPHLKLKEYFKFIRKDDFEEWELTKQGERMGGLMKSGQYGEYIAWTENIKSEIRLQ